MTDALVEAPTPKVVDEAGLLQRLLQSNVVLFLAWFALILLLKWTTLTHPPVWDGSMSVFPAAITLADHGFDLGYLLDQPGYADGGPNVHGFSLVTWMTAIVIGAIGDGPALFPTLHLLHFAIAAVAMTAVHRFAETMLSPLLAAASTLAALTFPLVLTQSGYLYLESPLLAATALAMLMWTRRRVGWVILWVSIATLVKGSGIIVAAALAAATVFGSSPARSRFRSGFLILFVPTALLALTVASAPSLGSSSFELHALRMTQLLIRVPDLVVLVLAYLLATLIGVIGRRRANGSERHLETRAVRPGQPAIAFMIVAFFLFYLALPLTGNALIVVPRYYVQIVPFVLIGLVVLANRRLSPAMVLIALLAFIGWSAINRNGDFYPDNNINNFPLIERSGAYVDLAQLQLTEIRALEELPANVPVFYDQPTAIKLSYPLLGYADGPLANGRNIAREPTLRSGNLEDFPEDFYLLYEYPWLGGDILRTVWRQAEDDPGYEVQIQQLEVAQFRSRLIHVTSSTIP